MNNVVSLDSLFHQRMFRIPDYQRGYSWETRQVDEFLDDLEILGPDNYHYTGTVVLHVLASETARMDRDGNQYNPVAIVDGQQRLTTIILLLDGVCRLLDKSNNRRNRALSKGIRKKFISTRAPAGTPLYKLSLNTDMDHFFKNSVLSDDPAVEGATISSQRRLQVVKDHIKKYLVDKKQVHGGKWLRTLYRKIATQLRFTLYEVENEADVGVIFEVMNDRGKPLTELEKVKNFLLHASVSLCTTNEPNELAESVNDAWAEILRQLMAAGLESSAEEDRLLRAHWLTNYDPQPRQWQGSRSIKNRFALRDHLQDRAGLLQLLHEYTDQLREDCVSYCDAYKPTRTRAFDSFSTQDNLRLEIVEWSSKLVRIGVVVPFLPLLFAARKRWPRHPGRYLQLLKLCEAFAFRVYRINGWRADAGQSMLFHIGHEVRKRRTSYADMLERIKVELANRCGDDDFKRETDPSKPADWYSWTGLRYLLYEYEIALATEDGATPKITWEELRVRELKDTIEHILPQSIDDQPYWKMRFNSRKHEIYLHDLGNLTLTKHNAHYSNKPFPEKKGATDTRGRCYAKSPLHMERSLTRWNHWKVAAIDERRTELLEWTRRRWAVDLDSAGGTTPVTHLSVDPADGELEDAEAENNAG